MLEVMRRNASSFLIQILFAIIVIVFVFWGVNTGGDRSQPVAKVNGESILDGHFMRAYQDRVRFAQRYNRNLGEEEIERIKNEVLDNLIVRELILQSAAREGIVVSDHELALHIMGMRQFQDEDGRFDAELYEKELRRYRQNKATFEENQRQDLIVQRTEALIRRSVQVSEPEVRKQYEDDNHELNLEFLRISSTLFRADVVADETRVQEYVADNEDTCRTYYDNNFDRLYHNPKRVQASQIFMATGPDDPSTLVDEVKRRMGDVRELAIADGADFADLATEYSEHRTASFGGDLGYFDENRQGDPYGDESFKAMAFSMQPGEVSEVVESALGLHLIRVENVEEASTQQFEDVKLAIAERLLVDEEAPEMARQYAEELAVAFSQGEIPTEVMARKNVQVQETGLFAVGNPSIPRIGTAPAILSAALAHEDLGSGPPAAYRVMDNWVVFRVIDEKLPNPLAYETEAETIRTSLLRRKRYERLQAWRDSLKAEADIVIFDIAL